MADQWGPWIDHDGKGCPPSVINSTLRMAIELACEDEWGGAPGAIRFQESLISPLEAENPMWNWENFGQAYHYTTGQYAGRHFFSGRILRYQLRQFSAMRDLKALAANPKQRVIS